MKRLVPIFSLALIAGCGILLSRTMIDIAATEGDFSLVRITGQTSVISSERIDSGNKAIFVEFGADSSLVAEYSRGSEHYTAEIVSFSSHKGALGVFAATELPGAYPVDIGDNARRNDEVVQVTKGPWFITVRPRSGAPMQAAHELADELAGNIPPPGIVPDIYGILPVSNRIAGSEAYFMGRRVFTNVFSEKLADNLGVTNIKEGASARYMTDDGEVTLIKIRYYSTERAKDALNTFIKSHADLPVLLPRESLQYYTVVHSDKSESFIADYAEWVYCMPESPEGNRARAFFEYLLRGGN